MEMNELVIETAKRQLTEAVSRLQGLCRLDSQRPAEQRIASLTHVEADGGRFVAVHGSAHMMSGLFTEFFRARPEFRSVVQDVLDGMYKIDNGF